MKTYTSKEAFADSHQAALTGNPVAQNFVGYCYHIGRGVHKDIKKAGVGSKKQPGAGRSMPFSISQ
jgi:hypothetical protein